MTDVDDINDAIAENAQGPRSATKDGESLQQHDIDAQIKAAQYLASQGAASISTFGLRRVKLVPPGGGN